MPRYRALMYADDVIMFIKPCREEITAARRPLDAFGEASGLRTNFAKSSLSPIRCDGLDLQGMIQELRRPMSALPCTYMGLPLAVSRLARAELQPVIDKVLNKMVSWSGISSVTGRLTLLVFVIFAMPIFQI
ncbi:hypothetical protein ACQ4PT_067451 [Festuca glaucescens]